MSQVEWVYHGKEKISCVSVDKNKRIETQREKQNENKPNDSSNDGRVDDLIKNTTTGTKKVKKTVTETLTIRNNSEFENFINYTDYHNITIITENKQISTVLPSGETTTDKVSNVELFLIFYYPSLWINISDIIDRIPSTTNDNDIITLNFKDIKGYVFLGYAYKDQNKFRIFNIKPYTGSKTYNIMNYDMTSIIQKANMSINYFDSLSDSIFYETDAFGNLIDDIPNFNVSTSGRTVIMDLDGNIDRTEDYGIDASFNFKFNNVLDANGINYESIENNILNIKYKDLKYIRDSLGNYIFDTNKFDGTTEFYKNLITYSDTYYNRTKSEYIDSFNNTISEGGILFSYCDIEENVDTQNKFDNYTYKDYFDIDLTYKEEVEESYTTTIEGTSDKINDNAEKAEKNKDEIEQLKVGVNKNKTNIDKLKQQVKSVTNKVGTMSNSLGSAKTDIAKLDIRVTNLENSGSSGGMTDEQKHQLEQNTTDISQLKTKVSKNTQNISTNNTDIANLTTRVSNLENSGGSGSGITEEERQQIQTNKTDIANNTKNISTNKTNIDNLTTRVSNLENSGGSGSGITETERQQIQTNKTDIANLTTRVTNLESSGGSGSGITETERQQIQTNKTNIENLSILVSGNTTSIEDILRRLAILEQGGGGETGETLKFTSFDIKFNKDKSNSSYYFPSFDINNYKIGDTYYISETSSSQLYYYLVASLNKMNSTQTFRSRPSIDSSDFTIIDQETLNLQSSDIQFRYANKEFYYDCESSLNDLYAKSNSIHVKTYSWVSATKDTNWVNETTGGQVTKGAHNGDIINLKTTITKGFKALNLENAPSELNKYYYKIIFASSSTNHDNSNSIIVADWTPLNVEPGVLTDIRFTFNSALGGKTVNLFISDGQYVIRADYDRIPLLT